MELFYHRKVFSYQKNTRLPLEFCAGILRLLKHIPRIFTNRQISFRKLGYGKRIVILSSSNQIKVFKSLNIEGDLLIVSPFEQSHLKFNAFFSSFNLNNVFSLRVHNYLDLDKLFFLDSIKSNVHLLLSDCIDIIVFNDHSFFQRLFLEQSIVLKKVSHYFQHAPVELDFPKNYFTNSYLWSERDSEIYKRIGSQSNHFIIGMYMKTAGITPKGKCIGVAINTLDNLKRVEQFIIDLEENYSVVVRPHPSMSISSRFLRTRIVHNEEYWSLIKLQYAGWSGVHFDALSRKIDSQPFPFTEIKGLLKDLIEYKSNPTYLIQTRDSIYNLGYVRNTD
jgi:hypothetical protein